MQRSRRGWWVGVGVLAAACVGDSIDGGTPQGPSDTDGDTDAPPVDSDGGGDPDDTDTDVGGDTDAGPAVATGLSTAPIDADTIASLAVGDGVSVAIASDGRVGGWGVSERLAVLPTREVEAVAFGQGRGCALHRGGEVYCWGRLAAAGPQGGGHSDLVVDGFDACAVEDSGSLYCWGIHARSWSIDPGLTVASLAMGGGTACAVDDDDRLWCWGSGASSLMAEPPDDLEVVSGVSGSSACGLAADGHVRCWGDSTPLVRGVPDGTFVDLQVAGQAACGVRSEGEVYCWGQGQVVDDMPVGLNARQLGLGAEHACAVSEEDTLWCWGQNRFGEATTPTTRFEALAMHGDSTTGASRFLCGMSAGEGVCWGPPNPGAPELPALDSLQIRGAVTCGRQGDLAVCVAPDDLTSEAMTPPAELGAIQRMSLGDGYACAIADDEALWCWGFASADPLDPPDGRFVEVSSGPGWSCALGVDGALEVWGDLADGRDQRPAGAHTHVSCGSSLGCAVADDGSVYCWGDGAPASPAGADFVAVSVGQDDGACGVRGVDAHHEPRPFGANRASRAPVIAA